MLRWLGALLVAISALVMPASGPWAQTAPGWPVNDPAGCGFLDKKVSFPDGGSLCLKDVYQAALRGDRDKILQGLTSSGNPYAIAVSTNPRSCPLSYRTYWSTGMDSAERNRKQAIEGCQRALDAAITRLSQPASASGCTCSLLIENGESQFRRADFDRLMSDYARQAQAGGRPLAALETRPSVPPGASPPVPPGASPPVPPGASPAAATRPAISSQTFAQMVDAQLAADAGRRNTPQVTGQATTATAPATPTAAPQAPPRPLTATPASAPTVEAQRVADPARPAVAQASIAMSAPAAQVRPAAPALAPAPVMANRKALLIGNDAYANVSRLETARADANALARVLGELGYKVTLRLDLDERAMKSALRQFRSEVEGGDEVVFFFAGHGVQIGGSNYLLPTDIRKESEEQVRDDGIPLQRVLEELAERRVKLTVAMIDACRDNPFPKAAGRSIGTRGLAPTTAATGQMVIFSAGAGQQALDRLGPQDRDPNGLFTRTLLREIRTPGMRVDNVIREVRKKVVESARTIGHEQVPAIYDQVVGDFYFVR